MTQTEEAPPIIIESPARLTKETVEFLRLFDTGVRHRCFQVETHAGCEYTTHYVVEAECRHCGSEAVLDLGLSSLSEWLSWNHFACPDCRTTIRNDFKESYLTFGKGPVGIEDFKLMEASSDNMFGWTARWYPEGVTGPPEVWTLLRSMPYRDFLKTRYWKIIAEQVKRKFLGRCGLCSRGGIMHVHHNNYGNHGAEIDYWEWDLICLCAGCHQNFHDRTK